MSAIVSGILNSTIGLLCSKLRDYTAKRLNEGDANDEKCRQIIVRELDDIKSKLDGLSRKDLLASLSFFKEGVTRLYTSLETSVESCDGPSTSQVSVEDQSEVEGATTIIPVTQAERDVVQRASELSELIGNLKIASQDRYKSAKESLKEAKRLATEAFNNAALSSEDRLMASKLRIASRILECLDDPEAAVRDCLLYLKELHDLPAVQAMFSVWYDSGKGIASRLRARFNRKKRNVNVDSIQMINALLIDLAMKFTNISMGSGCLSWPTIKIGKEIYHPILNNNAVLGEREKNDMQFTWMWKLPERIDYHGCALTGNGEILSLRSNGISLTLTRRNGECELFCTIPSLNEARCLAVDEHDNVYIVIEIPSCSENVPTKYKLLTFDANGNVKADRSLDITEETTRRLEMSVTKEGMIVIYCCERNTMYICDITNAKPDYEFPLPCKNVNPDDIHDFSLTVSNKNEIICTISKYENLKCFYMYIITMDGKLKRAVQVQAKHSEESEMSVVFNHVNETILVSLEKIYDDEYDYYGSDNDDSDDDDDDDNDRSTNIDFRKHDHTTIYSFSNTGELLHNFNIPDWYAQLISHPNGPIALMKHTKAVIIQML
jgi:hypothetical protein